MRDARKLARRDALRVVHIDTGRGWRGGQQQVYLLHRELIRRGVDSLLVGRSGGKLAARCRAENLGVAVTLSPRLWSPASLMAVRRLMHGVDLVHAHDSHAAGIAAVAGLGRPRPVVVCHRRVAYPVRARLDRSWKYREVRRWFAVSEEIGGMLRAAGVDGQRIRVVHSAIDVDGVRAAASASDPRALRSELGIPGGAPVVGTVGALVGQKGHAVLIAAASRVLSPAPDAVFVCVGGGRLRDTLEREAERRGVGRSIRFVGHRTDVAAVTALFDVAVIPSVEGEGSNAAIKEAMALAKPIVTTALEGNREVLGTAGVLVPAGDAESLGDAVADLLGDPARRNALGELATERSERFRPDCMVDAVVEEYRSLISGAGAREAA
jgi:glycosyltransferase involved in cell wall biosynthesis